jgi:hypothetical protein
MTEPTHEYRRDVDAQLDNLVELLRLQHTVGNVAALRRDLRHALSVAWTNGRIQTLMRSYDDEGTSQNPYDETDKA